MVKKPQINTKVALKLGLTLQQTYFLWLIYSEENHVLKCDRIYLSEKLMCSVSQTAKLTADLDDLGIIYREKIEHGLWQYHLSDAAKTIFQTTEDNHGATKTTEATTEKEVF